MPEFTFDQLPKAVNGLYDRLNDLEALIREKTGVNNNTTALPELYTRKQAADYLGISLPTLNEHTKAGTIPGLRIGGRVRYRKSDLENCLQKIEAA